MARVVALIPDLLFGSRVQGTLLAAGHEVELLADTARVRDSLEGAAVLVLDLTAGLEGAQLAEELLAEGALGGTRTLAFYSHVEVEARERAERAGIELVVPRSRMAREGAELVGRLANLA